MELLKNRKNVFDTAFSCSVELLVLFAFTSQI